jgi:hypothetical protein
VQKVDMPVKQLGAEMKATPSPLLPQCLPQ